MRLAVTIERDEDRLHVAFGPQFPKATRKAIRYQKQWERIREATELWIEVSTQGVP